jgi:hypothetical protein
MGAGDFAGADQAIVAEASNFKLLKPLAGTGI